MDNRPIGVFDSGLGGLTVVKELLELLPNESIVYFGDTARLPYGTRSKEIVTRYSAQCIRFLLSKDIKMVVIACNTASSASLDNLTNIFDLPIIGVIRPGAAAAVSATKNGKIGIAGTSGTIKSQAYPNAIKELDANIKVIDEACSLFVPIVEEGWSMTDIAKLTEERYLDNMKKHEVDTVVLGCTHYPLLTQTISEVMGPNVALINPAVGTALQVKKILKENAFESDPQLEPKISFYVSDFGQSFQAIGSHFLNMDIDAQCIDIEKY